eukprot:SM000096S24878  [mRNA]  locus=s96:217005:217910:- [translate_table: standard]
MRFAVDDGSGCAPVVLWLQFSVEPTPLGTVTAELAAQVAVGRIVRAQGRVTCYRGQLQLTASSLQAEAEDSVEVHHWLDCMRAALRSRHLPMSLHCHQKRKHIFRFHCMALLAGVLASSMPRLALYLDNAPMTLIPHQLVAVALAQRQHAWLDASMQSTKSVARDKKQPSLA